MAQWWIRTTSLFFWPACVSSDCKVPPIFITQEWHKHYSFTIPLYLSGPQCKMFGLVEMATLTVLLSENGRDFYCFGSNLLPCSMDVLHWELVFTFSVLLFVCFAACLTVFFPYTRQILLIYSASHELQQPLAQYWHFSGHTRVQLFAIPQRCLKSWF